MKKILLTIFTFFAVSSVIAIENNFLSSLQNCTPYTEQGEVETDGMHVKSIKQIAGKEADRCVYKENINFSGINTTLTCKFTQSQIKEITSVMNAYSLLQQYSGDNIDTSSVSNVQNNPVVKVWNKYIQDTSTCNFSGIN